MHRHFFEKLRQHKGCLKKPRRVQQEALPALFDPTPRFLLLEAAARPSAEARPLAAQSEVDPCSGVDPWAVRRPLAVDRPWEVLRSHPCHEISPARIQRKFREVSAGPTVEAVYLKPGRDREEEH